MYMYIYIHIQCVVVIHGACRSIYMPQEVYKSTLHWFSWGNVLIRSAGGRKGEGEGEGEEEEE